LSSPQSRERISCACSASDRSTGTVRCATHTANTKGSPVHAFHAAGLQAGGRDNGAPGLRPQYGPDYYAAFLFDPDGNNIEAVCHAAS